MANRSRLDRWRENYHRGSLIAVLAASLLASAAGIWYAVTFGTAMDGQLGGAVGVALSFLAMFAARPVPEKYLDGIEGDPPFKALPVEKQVLRLRNAMAASIDAQRLERLFLAIASVQGTFVWALGDRLARWLGATG